MSGEFLSDDESFQLDEAVALQELLDILPDSLDCKIPIENLGLLVDVSRLIPMDVDSSIGLPTDPSTIDELFSNSISLARLLITSTEGTKQVKIHVINEHFQTLQTSFVIEPGGLAAVWQIFNPYAADRRKNTKEGLVWIREGLSEEDLSFMPEHIPKPTEPGLYSFNVKGDSVDSDQNNVLTKYPMPGDFSWTGVLMDLNAVVRKAPPHN